jgi:hypothetical protein
MKTLINKNFTVIVGLLILCLAAFLRLYQLTSVPPSPYWEEVALGYDAYSISQTGFDHHGNFLPLVAVESFGDWKPSGYFYALVPIIKLFGLNLWSVRLPSTISGILITLGVGVLLTEFLKTSRVNATVKKWLPIMGMWVAAVSPWAIQFSRAGWEVNLATCLILWGIINCLAAISNSNKFRLFQFLWGSILLILSMYTYHAARIVAPLLGLGLITLWISNFKNESPTIWLKLKSWFSAYWKALLISSLCALFLLWPLIISLGKKETSQRFSETSIFSNLDIIQESNFRKERAGNTVLARFFYHRYILFGREVIINYIKHFDLGFLFLHGDRNPRHSIQYMGQLYHIEFVFLLLGIYWIFKNWRKEHGLLLFWLGIGILPAAITNASPHALRILPTLPVWIILISLGLLALGELLSEFLTSFIKLNKSLFWLLYVLVVVVIYLGEFTMFWRFYSHVYPARYDQEWQFGYQNMISEFEKQRLQNSSYNNQYITREYGRPVMYYFFYTQANPAIVQSVEPNMPQDQGELLEYQQLKFINNINTGVNVPALVAASPDQLNSFKAAFPQYQVNILKEIDNLKKEPIWIIFTVE